MRRRLRSDRNHHVKHLLGVGCRYLHILLQVQATNGATCLSMVLVWNTKGCNQFSDSKQTHLNPSQQWKLQTGCLRLWTNVCLTSLWSWVWTPYSNQSGVLLAILSFNWNIKISIGCNMPSKHDYSCGNLSHLSEMHGWHQSKILLLWWLVLPLLPAFSLATRILFGLNGWNRWNLRHSRFET